jgi:hypothetical protein
VNSCEVCGSELHVDVVPATNCGHPVVLCAVCKQTCPAAVLWCIDCEEE